MIAQDLRILIVDDEASIRNLLRMNLENHSFKVAEADTGKMGLSKATTFHPHLIILDLGLPDMSGFNVLQSLRQWTSVPVIILTVMDDEETKVKLLDAGADDYLTKPFSIPEFLARVRVALRHHEIIEATPVFTSGDLEVDLNKKTVTVKGDRVKLTATEFALLALLVRHHGKVVQQSHVLTHIWGPHAKDYFHYLRIYIGQLRKKIELNPSTPEHILTEPGVGYRLV